MQPLQYGKQLHLQQLLGARGAYKAVGLLDQGLVYLDRGGGRGGGGGAVYFHAGLVCVQLQHIGGKVQHLKDRPLACGCVSVKIAWS